MTTEAPKLFISYSWSNATHEQWVLDLATELRESGVDVILDKWDLREGHDALPFMEKMVTEPEIKKVLIIADAVYAAKADGRDGGVGTETQIISTEVYEEQEQDKFVAVIAEKDEKGKPYLPTYYKSRIYIDLSEPDKYAENFEQLLRWVFDKPLYVKPDIGEKPSFLDDEGESISLGTTVSFKRALDAIRNNKAYASGALDEYLTTFAENLERFRIEKTEGEFDDAVIKSIEAFIPYRNEVIQLFVAVSKYATTDENIQNIHRFFERLVSYMHPPENIQRLSDSDHDNFRFIIHELVLYAVAVMIRYERFDQANLLLEQRYYMPKNAGRGLDVMVSFVVFHKNVSSLDHRNKRLELRRLSLRADMLKERATGTGIEFGHIMQTDFILYIRDQIERADGFFHWWPETLLYSSNSRRPFEICARATSKKYFDRMKCLFGVESLSDMEKLITDFRGGKGRIPQWEWDSIDPVTLLGYDQLAKRP